MATLSTSHGWQAGLCQVTALILGAWVVHGFDLPYARGAYGVVNFTVTPEVDGCPLQSVGFIPLDTGSANVTPIFFIGGLAGVQASRTYSDLLSRVASHGYLVLGMDRLPILGDDSYPISTAVEKFLHQTQWLRHYVNDSGHVTWNRPLAMCHSEGCDVILNMILNATDLVTGVAYLDPFSLTSRRVSQAQVPPLLPSLALVSELSEILPACCIKGLGFRRFYELMRCTKVKVKVMGFGHCDLLDERDWKVCHEVGVCRTTNDSRLDDYKDFLTGLVTSFFQWTVDGKSAMMKYVIDPTVLPLPVTDLAFNVTCAPAFL